MKQKINKIKVLAMDVDGVLTDGRIILDDEGQEIKNFDVLDGFGLVLWKQAQGLTAIITARAAPTVSHRAKDLKIDKVYQNAYPKLKSYQKMLKEMKVSDEEVCFIGDDLPDLPVLRRVGLAVAVSNAVFEVKSVADYITVKNGGQGAVREVVELILKIQGKWQRLIP